MKGLKNNIVPLLFMLTIPISNIFYRILNNSSRGVYSLILDVDTKVPFIKEFIIPYIIWYPFIFIFLIYICLKNKEVYYRTLISINVGLIICYVIFYFFQTTVVRPELIETDIFTNIVRVIYSHDNPYNCFPSVHVITTYIVMHGINTVSKNKRILISSNVIGILIILSTQFVKQHVILDLIFAVVLGEMAFRLSIQGYHKGEELWIKKLFSSLTMKKKLES
ncbi:MAG: phosphatase PAP2 family protein [Clostridium sp.]|nr:phosphatase PAP2 family protein [Clostridium sp.]